MSNCARQPDFVYPTVVYELSDVLRDLMDFSAMFLKPGGRLVFWLPLITDTTHETALPHHPDLHLISNCEQPFNQCTLLMRLSC
jgi:tRNA (guanine10-N2)-methyltransferase